MPRARAASPAGSVYSVSSSSDVEEYKPDSPAKKRKRPSGVVKRSAKGSAVKPAKAGPGEVNDLEDLPDGGPSILRPHAASYHSVAPVAAAQEDVLAWFDVVRDKRGMPWRKPLASSMEERAGRAYEIWVSEVMLQQTQVSTVIAYWNKWIERWPTIADLAKADIEEVNAAWRGLGYYRRARSLLAGAKTVMGNAQYNGRLPDAPEVLEKEIDGIGRYTAGAIASMAYGVRAPIVDGNVHRLLTRLLAIHAPQAAPATIKALWTAAEELIEHLPDQEGVAGNWNQALMELGSQVCKPVGPECSACPLQSRCRAYAELSAPPVKPEGDECSLCVPIPASSTNQNTIPSVMVFPMRKEKKTSREEEELVSIIEWRSTAASVSRRWLFVKRPEKGLLAGLFEPLSQPVPVGSTPESRHVASLEQLNSVIVGNTDEPSFRQASAVPHIFSHINMVYHPVHLSFTTDCPDPPDLLNDRAVWLDDQGVEHANVGTGVKKVWAAAFGKWGTFEVPAGAIAPIKKSKKAQLPEVKAEGKIVKRIMMPLMPQRRVA